MSPRRVVAVARRIVSQFRHDHRSVGLLIVAPLVILSLVGALWGGAQAQQAPRVILATDRFSGPANVIDAFLASPAVRARQATFDVGMRELRDGEADGLVWLDSSTATLHIVIEGSDPLVSGSVATAVQRALLDGDSRRLGSSPVQRSWRSGCTAGATTPCSITWPRSSSRSSPSSSSSCCPLCPSCASAPAEP